MTLPQDPASPQPTEPTPQPAAEGTTPAERPRPEFGEYAPEGWTWQPPADEATTQDAATPAEVPAPQYGAIVPGAAPSAPAAGAAQPAVPARLAGVPHNLGAGQQRPGTPQHFEAPAGQPVQGPTGQPSATPAPSRKGDRVITILLLVVGAFGALQFAGGFMSLQQSFGIVADAFGMTDWVAPPAVATIGIVGTFIMLALYAATLLWSVQRMRRGKLAFFIPLIGAVVAFITMFVIIAIAMGQSPELFTEMTPERLQQLVDALEDQAQGL